MRYRNIVLLALALTLAGCGWKEAGEKIAVKRKATEEKLQEAKAPAPEIKHQPLTVTNEVWYGTQSVKLRQGFPLPAAAEAPRAVALVSAAPLSLQTIANQVSIQANIPVRLTDGAGQPISPSTQVAPTTQTSAVPSVIGGPGVPQEPQGFPVAYEGPLSGLLDLVAANFGITWRYDGSAILFSRYETRTFVMESLPGQQTLEDGVTSDDTTGSSRSGGSSGTSGTAQQAELDVTQDAKMSVELKFWEEFSTAIQTLLAGDGAYTISPSSGTVTVVAAPDKMTRIAEFVSEENRRLSRQMAVNVEVYTVDISDLDEFGLDLNVVFRASSAAPTFGLSGPATGLTSAGLGELATRVLTPTPGTKLAKFTGSSAVFQALSQVGDVARVAQIPLTTLNNRPASRQFVVNRAYLAEVNVTTDEGVTTTELVPGNIQTGITLQLVPRILPDGRILMQYSLTLRDLLGEPEVFEGSEGTQIQLPQTQARVFVQQAMMQSGSTLVLAGFEQDEASRSRQGMGHPANWLLGGGQRAETARQAMVIAITATEVDVQRPKGS